MEIKIFSSFSHLKWLTSLLFDLLAACLLPCNRSFLVGSFSCQCWMCKEYLSPRLNIRIFKERSWKDFIQDPSLPFFFNTFLFTFSSSLTLSHTSINHKQTHTHSKSFIPHPIITDVFSKFNGVGWNFWIMMIQTPHMKIV